MRVPSFSKLPRHRQFNYVPRKYNPEKEERERMFGRVHKRRAADKERTENPDKALTSGEVSQNLREHYKAQRQSMQHNNKGGDAVGQQRLLIFVLITAVLGAVVFIEKAQDLMLLGILALPFVYYYFIRKYVIKQRQND